jgi:hypothetical protein
MPETERGMLWNVSAIKSASWADSAAKSGKKNRISKP